MTIGPERNILTGPFLAFSMETGMKEFGVVILEGLIGVGKSTFCGKLAEKLGGEALFEPDETNNPFLPLYYKDPARWAYTMQTHLLSCRYRAHLYAQAKVMHQRNGWCVMDRSYFGDACFARVQDKLGYFSEAEFKSYFHMHKDMQMNILYPTAAVFLEASPETCNRRIAKRITEKTGSACESAIDLDYLRMLNDEIQRMKQDLRNQGVPVIEIDWNEDKTPDEIEAKAADVADGLRYGLAQKGELWTGLGGVGV